MPAFNYQEYAMCKLPTNVYILSLRFLFLVIMVSGMSKGFAWDIPPRNGAYSTSWDTETYYWALPGVIFSYTNDGTSQVRYSLTPPVEGSTAGSVFKNGWNDLDGKVVFRANTRNLSDNKVELADINIGGSGRDNKNGFQSGVFYLWYGKQAMATVNWTMYYLPFPVVTMPTGVIDLGTCHKSVKGNVLSKKINASIDIYGYLNSSTYSLTRTLTPSALPKGAYFTNDDNSALTTGVPTTLISSIPEPKTTSTDSFNALLNCDEADVGVQTWNVKVTYTLQ